MKRFRVTGITRDREYNLTPGEPGTKVSWFTANSNGEAEVVKVTLKPKLRLKTLQFDVDFSELAIKGRGAMGNIVTRNEVHRFTLKRRASRRSAAATCGMTPMSTASTMRDAAIIWANSTAATRYWSSPPGANITPRLSTRPTIIPTTYSA